MNSEAIRQLMHGLGPDAHLMETHISWVILHADLAWKIKKPVHFDFLDFSTIALRRHFCERELALNRRFSPDIYLGLSTIRRSGRNYTLDAPHGRVMDYAVRMRRLDQHRRLDLLIKNGEVGPAAMIQLAEQLSAFHQEALVCPVGHNATQLETEFRDLASVIPWLTRILGSETGQLLQASLDLAAHHIHGLAARLVWRQERGYTRDGHGDLHCRNIFLTDEPRLFDCLEFDDRLRQVDLLAEIAFLGADMQSFHRPDLWQAFLQAYQSRLPVILNDQDQALLQWFLWYRANVRLKVCCLGMRKSPAPDTIALQDALDGYIHYAGVHGQVWPSL